ncbi:MAG: cupin domain-containing protein [Methylococcales bacterium]
MNRRNKEANSFLDDETISVLAEALLPVAPQPERAEALKSRVLARVRGSAKFDLLTIRSDEGEWITIGPGVEKKILSHNAGEQVQSFLLRMAPNAIIPAHDHAQDEECLMLEGDISFGDLHLTAGDYHFAPKGSRHRSVSTEKGALAFIRTYEADS